MPDLIDVHPADAHPKTAHATAAAPPEVPIANIDQAAAWNGEEGAIWTEHADRYDRAGERQWQHLLRAVAFAPTDRVLDVGCGTGKSSRDVARMVVEGNVVGLDLSAPMLDLARTRAATDGLSNVSFVQGDAQVHEWDRSTSDGSAENGPAFALAISCFGAMFFGDAPAAFANIGRAVRPGGRLALLAWRDLRENDWLMEVRRVFAMGRTLPFPPPEAPTPFSLSDPERVRSLLTGAGFHDVALVPVDEPLDFGATVDDALAFARTMGIVRGLTHDLTDEQRAVGFADLTETFAAHARPAGVHLGSAAWLITAQR